MGIDILGIDILGIDIVALPHLNLCKSLKYYMTVMLLTDQHRSFYA